MVCLYTILQRTIGFTALRKSLAICMHNERGQFSNFRAKYHRHAHVSLSNFVTHYTVGAIGLLCFFSSAV